MNRRDFLAAAATLPAFASQPASTKSCIFLKLNGGPSQLDTWDMKPDAPSNIRSSYKAIKTNVPGIEISEIFPRMARHADKYALIRSCYHTAEPIHDAALLKAEPRLSGATFAQRCREAVNTIASGRTHFVTIDMFDSLLNQPTWDGHGFAPFSAMSDHRQVGSMFDQAYAALLEDLDRRGMLPNTLVVAAGEFGRTPRINMAGGRDHWPECFTIVMAGGGIRGGQIIGSSNKHGAEPKDRPVSPEEVAATIHHSLNIPSTGRPILELFG